MNRQTRIEQIIRLCLSDLSAGMDIDPESVAAGHPDLMPELLNELHAIFPPSATASPPHSAASSDDPWPRSSPHKARPAEHTILLVPPQSETSAAAADDTRSGRCLTPQDLVDWSRGKLSAASRLPLQKHLDQCESCRTELAEQLEFAVLAGECDLPADNAVAPPASADAAPPVDLPNHEFVRLIESGGQGQVWLCRHTQLAELRAVKLIMLPDAAAASVDEAIHTLVEEARIMGRLPRHPHRMLLHDCVIHPPYVALIMELIDGPSLSALVAENGPLAWPEACQYVSEIASGLEDVHAAGILHRDIKPANILVDRTSQRAVLVDFGLAATPSAIREHGGTPGYLPPELLAGQVTEKSDVFSLAATLFFLGTGQTPFDSRSARLSLQQARAGLSDAAPVWQQVPVAVRETLMAGLDPNTAQRSTLARFAEDARSAHLQTLADSLNLLAQRCASRLSVRVSTATAESKQFIACEPPEPSAPPASVSLHTGDFVRFDVSATHPGYLTVINLDSAGHLDLVFPPDAQTDSRLTPARPHELVLQLSPPAGSERMVFIATQDRRDLNPDEWRSLLEQQAAELTQVSVTRGLQLLSHDTPDPDWSVPAVSMLTIRHDALRPGSGISRTRSSGAVASGLPDQTGTPTQANDDSPTVSENCQCPVIRFPTAIDRGIEHTLTLELPLNWSQDIDGEPPEPWEFRLVVPDCRPASLQLAAGESRRHQRLSFTTEVTGSRSGGRIRETTGHILFLRGSQRVPVATARFSTCVDSTHRKASHVSNRSDYRNMCSGITIEPFQTAYICCPDANRDQVRHRLEELSSVRGLTSNLSALVFSSGERWDRRLVTQLEGADLGIVFLSDAALHDPWFQEEVTLATRLAAETGSLLLLPIVLDTPSDPKSWPRRLQTLLTAADPTILAPR